MPKLLIIDDEEGIRKVLTLSLTNDGYDVSAAAGGEEGIEIFKRESPPIILTDIKMPGMDGIEILKQIKELNPDAEVIMITGHGDMDLAIEALKLDASDFLNKPIKDEALSIALKRAEQRIAIKQKLKAYTDDLERMVRIATEEVKRRAEFQNKLITSSNDAIIATDEKGDIIIYNKGAEGIFGHSRSEIIRKMNIDRLYPQEIASEFRSGLKMRSNIDLSEWKEVDILSKNGEIVPARFSGSILYAEDEVVGSVGFFQDLREIKRLQKELITSERLAATGQTVAGLAHYIKNILNGLKGGAYVLNVALDKSDTDKIESGWKMIERNVGRISDLVLDLLAYSKERQPEKENCFPNEIIKEVYALMESRAAENNIEIKIDLDPLLGEVYIDPKAIHRSLLNLVSNAIDACIFDSTSKKRWQVKITSSIEENHVIRFEVVDNGIGMDKETKEKIFSSLFSTKGERGTGLGLLVTEKIIKENGGMIQVASQKGSGTTFTVYLPYQEVTENSRQREVSSRR
ncbi:MAG: histidine kinase [Deltaproteobacteria bacterium]|nr:MAG: histidine kinase [Deltaproteobacteria bacterium]